jgi:hypothetical protein
MLKNETLINIIKTRRKSALGPDAKEISRDRAAALDRYHGRPDGHEQEGHSQVVTRDLAETVGWVLPTIIRTFLQSGSLAEFVPVGEEDEDAAEQETDYVNHVVMKDNDGFIIIHDTAWDALVLKNCYAKHWWDETSKTEDKEYSDITEDELVIILHNLSQQYDEVNITSAEQDEDGLINAKCTVTTITQRCHISPTPPEELRISNTCRGSLQDADFVEHFPYTTRSDLIEMGMSKDFVNKIGTEAGTQTSEEQNRNTVSDENDQVGGLSLDRSMEEVTYCETYLKVDRNEDGIAELVKVISVNDQIPEGDEWVETVESIPFTGGVTKRIPHRHAGESLDDDLKDLQLINTALLRQMLTNIYLTNNQEWLVNERVDEASFLVSMPGGIKRVHGTEPIGDSAKPVETIPILNQILPAIDHVRGIKEDRTGISRTSTGLDPDTLRDATKGAFLENLNRASQKVEMIVRTYAETFVKDMVLRVHEILLKNQDKERVIKLRGKYVPIKPDEWRERTDLTVKVGLGTGNNEDKIRKLSLLDGLQKQVMSMGLAGPEEVYALFNDMAKTLGEDTPEKYVTSPDDPKFMENKQWLMGLAMQGQQQGNPLAEVEQIKGQFKLETDRMKQSHDAALKQLEMQHKAEMQMVKDSMDADIKMRKIESDEAIATMREEVKAFLEGARVDIGEPGIGAEIGE